MEQELAAQRSAVFQIAARLAEARKLYKQGVALLEQNQYNEGGDCVIEAAQMGDSMAQDHLGYLFEQGFFGEPDFSTAVEWYSKSADQCLPNGQFHLGACYQLGNGVEQNWEEAARLFELASKTGHPEATECLQMLRDMGVEPGPPPAPAPKPPATPAPPPVVVVAREPEPEPEPEPMAVEAPPERPKRAEQQQIIEEMPELPADLDDPSVTDAVAAYQAYALGNDAMAQLKLGIAYYRGRSAPADAKLACFWVMRSMFAGSQQAAQYLKYCVQRVPPADQGKLQSTIFMWAPGQPVPQL